MACSDAQKLMALSMKKIIESRGRRGGPCLRRNLLVAGVLFKARDSLILAQTAAGSILETPTADSDTDRKSGDESERTSVPEMEISQPSPIGDTKENVAPENQPDNAHLLPVVSTADNRKRRRSRDSTDDDVTPPPPCKTSRIASDLSEERGPSKADITDDLVSRQSNGPQPEVVVRRSITTSGSASRLPTCLEGYFTTGSSSLPLLVRPLLVVQVV